MSRGSLNLDKWLRLVPLPQPRSVLPLSYEFYHLKTPVENICCQRLIEEGNALRREIKAVANEYDIEWDELEDEKDEVSHALRKEREKKRMEVIRSMIER